MFKRALIMIALVSGFAVADAADANAWIVRRRIAPVRRAARVALPPYPVARRIVAGPVYRPIVRRRAPVYYGPSVYVAPSVYYAY